MTLTKSVTRLAVATAFLLLIPLVAMQFTPEVVWTLSDFVVAGLLLFGAGLTFELAARQANTPAYRVAVGVTVAVALFLVWTNLAVGLIGSENNPANLLYGGVLGVLFIGTIVARLQPRGMSHALFATALAQMAVPVLALLIWKPLIIAEEAPIGGIVHVLGVNVFFAALWVGAALLFRRASAGGSPQNRQLA
ncbi:hypothetical protein [Hymenobacter cavernae]|uniref:Uncharacterized protein n=1 Tax=Hymenobacter cavernae TaxID=2044852 RepID=A0ABQ1TIQ6_9BACT|nr:hypothetical protein [Hymenobacter cavernae]GGE93770.1 hypothetical protein GCM10011383_00590 [Hymenobacter cavernae]